MPSQEQIEKGIRTERKEHPWLNTKELERLVRDHIKIHPYAYLR